MDLAIANHDNHNIAKYFIFIKFITAFHLNPYLQLFKAASTYSDNKKNFISQLADCGPYIELSIFIFCPGQKGEGEI